MYNYGEEFKYHRLKAGLTQSELARLTGIKQQSISCWEKQQKMPGLEYCIILADFYGISLDELVGRNCKKK